MNFLNTSPLIPKVYNKFLSSSLVVKKKYFNSFIRIQAVHFSLEKITSWSFTISYFFKFSLIRSCNFLNRKRLKNIFSKVIHDGFIWNEVEKILMCGSFHLFSYNNLNPDFFYQFILNIYLSEFDLYFSNLCLHLTSKLYSYQLYYYNKFNKSKVSSFDHAALKFSINLLKPFTVKTFDSTPFFKGHHFTFSRHTFYVRHFSYFFFGIVGSVTFLLKLKLRILTFLKGNLYLDVNEFFIMPSDAVGIHFLGYKILFSNKPFVYLFSGLQQENSLKRKLRSRIDSSKFNFNRLFLSRIYFEFLSHIRYTLNFLFEDFVLVRSNKVWIKIFSYEAIKYFYSSKFSTSFNSISRLDFEVYYFDLFVYRVKRDLLFLENNFSFYNSFLPFDLSFSVLLQQFKSNTSFLYFSLFDLLEYRSFFLRSYFGNTKFFFSGFLFNDSELLFLFNYYSNNSSLITKAFFRFFLPLDSLLLKFQILGFFHPFKKRPMGNITLFVFEDYEIISLFRLFSFTFFIWYKKAFNFHKIRFILDIFKKSCFLTLSRKHGTTRYSLQKVYRLNSFSFSYFFEANYSHKDLFLNPGKPFFNEDFFLSL